MNYSESKKLRKHLKSHIKPEIIEELKIEGFIEKEKVLQYVDELIKDKTTPTKFQKIMNWVKVLFLVYLITKIIYLIWLGDNVDQKLLLEAMTLIISP